MILLLTTFAILFPIGIVIFAAFKSDNEFLSTSTFTAPDNFFNFGNFVSAYVEGNMSLAFLNIFYIIILAIVGNVLIGTMVAFALGRFEFKMKKVILAAYALAAIVPTITTQVATFQVIKFIGLTNTHYAAVLIFLSTDLIQIYIYLQFVKNIPKELDESAYLEGASLVRIYRSIIFPLLAPATATVIIIKVISIYNDVFIPYLYMSKTNLIVVSTALMRFQGDNSSAYNTLSAAVLLILVPTVILYLFLQRYIFAGIVNGAVK